MKNSQKQPYNPCAPRFSPRKHDILFIQSNYNGKVGGKIKEDGSVCTENVGGEWFKKLKEKNPHLQKYKNLEIKNYIKNFNKRIALEVIENRDGVLLPLKMGTMFAATFGRRTRAVMNWTCDENGNEQYYKNEHSERHGCGICWSPSWDSTFNRYVKEPFENYGFWYFTGGTYINHLLAKSYIADWKKYWVLTSTRRIDDIVYSYKKKAKAIQLSKSILKDYNEFKF